MDKEILLSPGVQQFITKSFVVEAIQYNGSNKEDLEKFMEKPFEEKTELPEGTWIIKDPEGKFYASSDQNFKIGFDKI
jgi:hypothetical protein